jgi:hypothetical protein
VDISANAVREVRTTGAQTNSGGFVTGASGTDYSQQDAAQYALTDVTTAAADAICLHASAAADMVGNLCYIVSGTNFIVGWYEIISVSVGVSFTLNVACTTAAGAAGVINIGGAFLIGGTRDDEFTESLVPGNTVHVKTGTYTLGEALSQQIDGTASNLIKWIGYTAARNDACVGTNRPLIVAGANTCGFGGYSDVKNFRFTSEHAGGVYAGAYSFCTNCKSQNTSITAGRHAFNGNSSIYVSCEGISNNGIAFYLQAADHVLNCYAHDSVTGIEALSHQTTVFGSIIDTCTTGIQYYVAISKYRQTVIDCTIYNCGTGISGGANYWGLFLNNIITACTIGASWTAITPNNYWDYNCWNNTTDVSNVTKGPHDITADPLLNAPATADFTLAAGSPCFDAGIQPSSDIGLP